MRFNLHPALVVLVLLGSSLCLPAAEAAAENTNLVIGLLVPPEESQAASLRDGATLGVESADSSGGPHCRLVIRGRTGQWGADGVEAARMATDDGALGLISPPDGAASHLVLQVSGRTAVPVISLCGDSSVTQTGVPWMARIVPRTAEEAEALLAGIHARKVMALVPDERAGRETARDLRQAATNSGCSIDKIIEVNPSMTNAARLGRQILANRPDAVLLWLDPAAAGTMAKTLRAAGFTGTLAGASRLRSPDFTTAAGEAAEGLIVPAPVLDPEAAAAFQHFTQTFSARFGREPDATATSAYDASCLLIHILKQTGDRPAHESFPIIFPFAGASGVLAFDSHGNRKLNLQLLEAHDGQFVSVKTGKNR